MRGGCDLAPCDSTSRCASTNAGACRRGRTCHAMVARGWIALDWTTTVPVRIARCRAVGGARRPASQRRTGTAVCVRVDVRSAGRWPLAALNVGRTAEKTR